MAEIKITITDDEMKALAYIAVDPVEWVTNFTKVRAAAAMQEIYDAEVARMIADPKIKTIPADKAAVVSAARIKSAAERHKEFLAKPPVPVMKG
jgi:malonyl CoA-acyl carrier protein transacylase